MDEKAINNFIDTWGEMGTVWGLNNSMARVHALLIVSEAPMSLDAIAQRLKISRGNASMSLKELRNWGVVNRVKEPGDRQDFYVTEPDIWKMFFAIARERKKREFNPTLAAVRETLKSAQANSATKVADRLTQMENFLGILDKLVDRFIGEEDKAKYFMDFLAGSLGPKK